MGDQCNMADGGAWPLVSPGSTVLPLDDFIADWSFFEDQNKTKIDQTISIALFPGERNNGTIRWADGEMCCESTSGDHLMSLSRSHWRQWVNGSWQLVEFGSGLFQSSPPTTGLERESEHLHVHCLRKYLPRQDYRTATTILELITDFDWNIL